MLCLPLAKLKHTTGRTSQNWEQDEPGLKPRCPASGNLVVESNNWGVCGFLDLLQKLFQKNLSVDSLCTTKPSQNNKQTPSGAFTSYKSPCFLHMGQLNNATRLASVKRLITWALCTEVKLHKNPWGSLAHVSRWFPERRTQWPRSLCSTNICPERSMK